ncbi:MAG: tetratricopeptide repeat protein [Bdellovibrionales bacterium]
MSNEDLKNRFWYVRIPSGEEFGPLNADALFRLIDKGILNEADLLGEEPHRFWVALTHTPFYDRFVDSLEKTNSQVEHEEKVEELQKSVSATLSETKNLKAQTPPPQTKPEEPKQFGTAKVKTSKKKTIEEPKPSVEPTPPPVAPAKPRTIELKEKKKAKIQIVPTALLGIAFCALIYILYPDDGHQRAEPIRLLAPGKNINNDSSEEIEKSYKKITAVFESDTVTGYVWAMNELVRILENNQKRADALSLLCMTYRELWPFAYQDETDKLSVQQTLKIVGQIDPTGLHSSTCRSATQLMYGKTQETVGLIDSLLAANPTVAIFYEFKAETLANQGDLKTAIGYLQKTQQLWPQWAKPFVSEAHLQYRLGDASTAANLLREKNKRNPKHDETKALLGIIEWQSFKHPDQAQELLLSALTGTDRLLQNVEAQASYALAQVYGSKKNTSEALEWAKRAYALDAALPGLSAFIQTLGGEKILNRISKTDRDLMALGDQYVLGQNYLAAQAQYKAAFEANPKNATAAFKTAQSLWQLNQSQDAIAWVNKAIQTNPNLIEAYVTLADYYSQKFDFIAAAAILQKAQKISPKRYEIFHGYALVEYRRNNYKGAITSAKRALALYDTNIPTMILLAQAYKNTGDAREAYSWISHAIELDKGNPEAQSFYAEVLTDVQGSAAGINYIRKLVEAYPSISEYKINLARILKKEGKVAEAAEILKSVTNVEGKNKRAFILQGEYNQQLNRLDEALASFLAAAALDPSDAAPLFSAGNLYLQFNKPLPAVSQFERVLSINPRFPRAHYSLGKAHLILRNTSKAMAEAQAEKRLNPNVADAYLLAGDIQMAEKQYSKATMEYQAALKLRSQGSEVYVKLAQAYRLSGQYDVALSMLRIAEAKESGNAEIFKEYGALYEMKGDNMSAVRFYNRYLQILPNAMDRSAIADRIKNIGGSVE